jgi:acetyltransferase-like isoleucine patch superfamily enzyme
LYYYARYRCIVHPKARVQIDPNIRFGRHATVHPYARVTISGGSLKMGEWANIQTFSIVAVGSSKVTIGNHVRVGPNTNLIGVNHVFHDRETPIHRQPMEDPGLEIGDDVWIGANCVVLPGVKIGRGAVVGAGTVVTKDVPEFAVLVGNPGRVIRYR